MKTNKILLLLKMRGPLTALDIAKELKITKEGVRLQLVKFIEEGLVEPEAESKGVGRPQKFFRLTDAGNSKFPDTHAELTVRLIDIINNALGEDAMQTVIATNEAAVKKKYHIEIDPIDHLESKIEKLVEIRNREGYMAEYSKDSEGFVFIENHCPICAAATSCLGFCTSELNTFRSVLGKDVIVNRISHIISGDRRCAYRISQN